MIELDKDKQVELVRPFWDKKLLTPDWQKDVTVLICQYETKDITQLCIESLLRFYPTISILVVNGSPHDDLSTNYLRYMSLKYDNIHVWERVGVNSHGVTMDEAIRSRISTKYVLLMDSDVITMQGGYIEGMLVAMMFNKCYAIGTLMKVTRKNDACGLPFDDSDVLRYAHPSCSLYDKDIYLTMSPFVDHGAPCVYSMKDAEKLGHEILYFPIDEFVIHLSGASWCKPKTVWESDFGTFTRPFITFIVNDSRAIDVLRGQDDQDFDMVCQSNPKVDECVIHGSAPFVATNGIFRKRFSVKGEYVAIIDDNIGRFDYNFVTEAKRRVVENKLPDTLNVGGIPLYERRYWQKNISML